MYRYLFLFLCAQLALGDRSLTIVLDTTESMQDEVDILKANIGPVLSHVAEQSDISNYIMVLFNDPDVGPPLVQTSPQALSDVLNRIKVGGGHDCPENSLSGIERALQASLPESYIFVYTDAYAKDYSKVDSITQLCKSTRSQVNIFLSGNCLPSGNSESVNIYYDVTKSCSGSVFQFDLVHLRQAFKYIKELTKVDWTDISTYNAFADTKQITYTLDSFTTDFVVAISGENPSLQMADPRGETPILENILHTRHSLVARVLSPVAGEYRMSIRSQSVTTSTFYRRNNLPFQFGFCPRYGKSLRETSKRPMPGRTNYILIQVDVSYSATFILKSVTIEIVDFVGNANRTTPVLQQVNNRGLYAASVFIEPDKQFRMTVLAQDTVSYQERIASTKIFSPQMHVTNVNWSRPTLQIIDPESNTFDFGTNVTLPCKVNGYPTPGIWWEDENGATLPSETVLLEIPSVYISYVTVVNMTSNATVQCKCRNTVGEASQSTDLFVQRPYTFEVIQKPEDKTIEYGSEGELECEVDAYPEVKLTWYHNDTKIESDNTRFVVEEHTLLIKAISLEDAGTYKCEAINAVKNETFAATVDITGIDPPRIDMNNSELSLKPGDWTEIECSLSKGMPLPTITWSYKSPYDSYFYNIPEGVYIDGGKLKIPTVNIKHSGVYKCEAVNILGVDSGEVTISIKYAPIIKNSDPETLTVNEGTPVALPCQVDASPTAEVRWEMSQDDVIIPLDGRHTIDDKHTLRFDALWKDSGNYHCFAENNIGRTEKTFAVNVLVGPYIKPLEFETMTVNRGESLVLDCNVLFGNPVPATKWEFMSNNYKTTVLSRGNSTNTLRLYNIGKGQEGSYMCIADNKVGIDSIKVSLRVL